MVFADLVNHQSLKVTAAQHEDLRLHSQCGPEISGSGVGGPSQMQDDIA